MKNAFQKRHKKIIILLALLTSIFAGFQIASPRLENPPVKKDIELPQDVKKILVRACYDCHSNHTAPAWFDQIVPASYLVEHDIKKGRAMFNFSDWDKNSAGTKELLLWEMVNAIEENKMPLPIYSAVHPDSKVTAAELTVLKRYVNTLPGRSKIDTARILRPTDKVANNGSKKDPGTPVSANGIAYAADYKTWQIISVTDKFDGGSMRVVYGNDIMIKAIKNHQLPFPDGAKIVKAVWGKQSEDQDGNVLPGNFQNVQVMIKDSRKYKSTEGWGFAKFEGSKLKPVGTTPLFANSCINCHRLLVAENDFVFNVPTK